jgi:putative tryptophan/tyrosine transport system substrate-binding protein
MREDTTMPRSTIGLLVTLALSLLVVPIATEAQPPQTIPRIGFLAVTSLAAIAARIEAFRQGLRELGYMEGHNIVIEYRSAEGHVERAPALAAALVRLQVAVIVTAGPIDTRHAKHATSTIPIVMTWDQDPIGSGFVASLARPGRNVTGLSSLAPEISGKHLELLTQLVPRLSRVAFLGNATEPGNAQVLSATEAAARAVGVQLQYVDMRTPADIEPAFRAARQGGAQAVLVLTSPVVAEQLKQVVDLARQHHLPAIYHRGHYVEAGGLMSYGVIQHDLDRRAATYVHKILQGAKPADLPVEQPMKFELVINRRTAQQMGLTLPPAVLYQADRVIP